MSGRRFSYAQIKAERILSPRFWTTNVRLLTTDRKFTYSQPWNVLSGFVRDQLYERERDHFIASLTCYINTDNMTNINIHVLKCQQTILKFIYEKW